MEQPERLERLFQALSNRLETLGHKGPYGGQLISDHWDPDSLYRVRDLPGTAYPESVALLVWENLQKLERTYEASGGSLSELGSPEELARRMVAVMPTPSPWGDLLGTFFSPGKVARILGDISRQAVADRRNRGTLLGLKTADGTWVYPAFQFDDNHRVLPGLAAVVRTLRESEIDDWTLASWLMTQQVALDGRSPIEWLRADLDQEQLSSVAMQAAHRFG